jgi:hypothetical protein
MLCLKIKLTFKILGPKKLYEKFISIPKTVKFTVHLKTFMSLENAFINNLVKKIINLLKNLKS